MSKSNHGAEAQGGGGSHQGDSRQPGAGANSGAGNSKKNDTKLQPAGAGGPNKNMKEEEFRPGMESKEEQAAQKSAAQKSQESNKDSAA